MRALGARADSAAFRRRLPRQPAKPGDGKLAAEPSAEVPRAQGLAPGRFVVRSRRARRKSERAARRVLLVEAAAAPPDGPSASHCLWVTDTLSEGGEGLGEGRGPGEGPGLGRGGRRCRGAEWSLGSCSSPTEARRATLLRMLSARWALRMLGWGLGAGAGGGGGVGPHCYYGHRHSKEENVFSAAAHRTRPFLYYGAVRDPALS